MSDSVRPHRWQPTRPRRPWDSPGKNTGVGWHFLLQCMKVKSESEVAQSCPTLRNPMDCSPPGSSAHEIFQARVLEWGATAFSKVCLKDCIFPGRYALSLGECLVFSKIESDQRAAQGRKKKRKCEINTYRDVRVPSGFRARPGLEVPRPRSGNAEMPPRQRGSAG